MEEAAGHPPSQRGNTTHVHRGPPGHALSPRGNTAMVNREPTFCTESTVTWEHMRPYLNEDTGGDTNGIQQSQTSVTSQIVVHVDAGDGGGSYKRPLKWPMLIKLAFWLAILEKAAGILGLLGFIWATVVLLGGFASDVKPVDFWFVTTILVVQGTRIFSRSHQLRWQHHRDLTGDDAVSSTKGTTTKPKPGLNGNISWWVPMVSKTLFGLQILSSVACGVLCLLRLTGMDFIRRGDGAPTDGSAQDLKGGLIMFYSLVLSEAVVSLGQKLYWWYNFSFRKLLVELDGNYEFKTDKDHEGGGHMEHFFYYVYSICIHGHALDGLQADLTGYAQELLLSNKPDKQLRGATILNKLTSVDAVKDDSTLLEIGNNNASIERLMEMLGWENTGTEIRTSAAKIVLKLLHERQIAHRLASIPGCMESISSLISDNGEKEAVNNLSVLGLEILMGISVGDENCGKIGRTRGLLPKIINFTGVDSAQIRKDKILAVQVLRKLARTEGPTGSHLRSEMLENVFVISNLKRILLHQTHNSGIQDDAVDVLKYLATGGKQARSKIGSAGGIIDVLVKLFVEQNNLRAGKALYLLSLGHPRNCQIIMSRPKMVDTLQTVVENKLDHTRDTDSDKNIIYSVNILRSLVTHGLLHRDSGVTSNVLPIVLDGISKIPETKKRLVQSYLGLAVAVCSVVGFHKVELEVRDSLIEKLIHLLEEYEQPSTEVPNIRRYIVELTILMMKFNKEIVVKFKSKGLYEKLEKISNTTSELESFYMFSGSIGLDQHSSSMQDLVENAMKQLSDTLNDVVGQ